MAKLENKELKVGKKSKGKKRKHTTTKNDLEEEVASKSVILETLDFKEEATAATSATATKAAKRKNKEQNKIKEKRKRTEQAEQEEDNSEIEEHPAEALHEPTAEELRESDKPENRKAIVTNRQKKKQNHQQRLDSQKSQTNGKELKRNEEYLCKWKHARAEWKFEKLRQIAIHQSVFDEQKIDSELWPIALEYLTGTKGAAKDKICNLAEEVIDNLDKQCAGKSEEEQQEIVNSAKYQRARDLLQNVG